MILLCILHMEPEALARVAKNMSKETRTHWEIRKPIMLLNWHFQKDQFVKEEIDGLLSHPNIFLKCDDEHSGIRKVLPT